MKNENLMSRNAIDAAVDDVLRTLDSGIDYTLYCINGGGFKDEFETDYTLEGCGTRYQELIKELQSNGCKVKAEYRTSFDSEFNKEYLTKVLVISLAN